MKYCILKGIEGFGDRLQCLINAIEYCYNTNRTLVVDWRDCHWTQGTYFPIYKFLQIKNIDYLDIIDFLKYRYKEHMSVESKSWKPVMHESNYAKYMYRNQFRLKDNNAIMSDIMDKKIKDFENDIVVYPGVGVRRFRRQFAKFIDFHNSIYSLIYQVYRKYNIEPKEYICIHIRATSKEWESDKSIVKSLKDKIKKFFPNEKKYFIHIDEQLKKINEELPILIISDCMDTASRWVEKNKKGVIIENERIQTNNKSGIHLMSCNHLGDSYKYNLNLLCLRDFLIMKNSKYLIWDNISLYSRMANFYKNDKS